MAFEIRSRNSNFGKELEKSAPPGVIVRCHHLMTRSAVDPGWIIVTLEFIKHTSVEVDIALFTAWLYDKTKNDKSSHINKRGKRIIKTKPEIGKWIQEQLDIRDSD